MSFANRSKSASAYNIIKKYFYLNVHIHVYCSYDLLWSLVSEKNPTKRSCPNDLLIKPIKLRLTKLCHKKSNYM